MKKILIFITTLIALISLNGCNSTYNGYDDYPNNGNNLTTLFLVDGAGLSYANIPYICDSMNSWSQTANNGEFSFIDPESCEFDFNGLNGIYGDNLDDIVRIVDYTDEGKGSIPYTCSSFGVSSTYTDGSFDYDQDDVCTFHL